MSGSRAVDAAPAPRWAAWQLRAWALLNASTAPVWLLMILLPKAGLTRRVVAVATVLHAGLGLTYTTLLARGVAGGGPRVDFSSGPSVARGLQQPDGMLAAWTHYLTFDLFVGQWIHATALEEGINARLALLLTWWAGPAGLTLFLWQRRRAARRAG